MSNNDAHIDQRARIFARDAHRCVYCGNIFPAVQLTLDHVEPRMRGGDRSAGNLVTCCASCNVSKGGRPAWAWLAENDAARANFLRFGAHVWPRLRRAVEEAAVKQRRR